MSFFSAQPLAQCGRRPREGEGGVGQPLEPEASSFPLPGKQPAGPGHCSFQRCSFIRPLNNDELTARFVATSLSLLLPLRAPQVKQYSSTTPCESRGLSPQSRRTSPEKGRFCFCRRGRARERGWEAKKNCFAGWDEPPRDGRGLWLEHRHAFFPRCPGCPQNVLWLPRPVCSKRVICLSAKLSADLPQMAPDCHVVRLRAQIVVLTGFPLATCI